MKILVLIPTFNDGLLIPSLVKSVLALGDEFHTLVIDDGSDPALKTEGLSGHREKYFRCPYNVGLGIVTNIALDYAHQSQFDILLRIDADGQHPLDCLLPIIEAMMVRDADVIVGVRSNSFSFGSSREVASTLLKLHMNATANWVSGLRLDEWHSGLIVLSRTAIKKLRVEKYERYPEVEILLKAVKLGLNVDQFPVTQNQRKHGISTITLRGGIHLCLRFYMLMLRHLVERRT
jgi:glycosyltransferase involved in cell wall biosynthesis